MKRMKGFVKWAAIGIGGMVVLFVGLVYAMQNKTYVAPLPAITASPDSAVIARGRHLVYGPAHCNFCHGSWEEMPKILSGETVDLKGGNAFNLPLGIIRTPNITNDMKTGIGGLSDAQIARALRYGVGHDGRALFDFMPFHNLSDDDLTAVISYLRTLPPVENEVVVREINFAGKTVNAFLIKPVGPDGVPPKSIAPDSSAAYGKYLAHSVANCVGCHTQRDMMTGAFTGNPFAGGLEMDSDIRSDLVFTTPNLTPDRATGKMADWGEDEFILRFRAGVLEEGTVMPWGAFKNMTDMELKAIYRYLRTVPAVTNEVKQVVRKKEG
jgi:mono/diheme cytochrome c family protein